MLPVIMKGFCLRAHLQGQARPGSVQPGYIRGTADAPRPLIDGPVFVLIGAGGITHRGAPARPIRAGDLKKNVGSGWPVAAKLDPPVDL